MEQDVFFQPRRAFKGRLHAFLGSSSRRETPPPQRGALRSKGQSSTLMNEAESRKKDVSQDTFTNKKLKALPDHAISRAIKSQSCRLRVIRW